MQITLTKEQYEKLMELVYLGNWMANSYRGDERIEDYDRAAEHILSFAPSAGHQDWVEFDEFEGRYFPSRKLDEDLKPLVDDYDDDVFWNVLIDRLAERDLVRAQGEEAVDKMDWEEYSRNLEPYLKKYEKEIDESGVEHLEIFKIS
ncbi:MAG: hypothetical protein A2W03_09540 [Candidatus Aminicenantes bacterium RBG_16_63_16]|nr:MAG: hypothetical protein A2W03_09540 [Candidatus Aminicenantes bacterium RBG_16_63_16]